MTESLVSLQERIVALRLDLLSRVLKANKEEHDEGRDDLYSPDDVELREIAWLEAKKELLALKEKDHA